MNVTDTLLSVAGVLGGNGGGGGGDITLTTLNVSANGTTNAPSGTAYNKVVASVPNTYAADDEGKVVSNGALVSQTSDTVTANDTYDTTLINSLTVDVSGGGGGGITLLASGTYTKASGTSLAIPVSYNGTAVAVLVEVDGVTSGTAQSIAWARCFSSALPGWTDPNDWMHGGPGGNMVRVQYANDSLGVVSGNTSYVYLSADYTTLNADRQSSTYPVLNGTYNWYIWGIPT